MASVAGEGAVMQCMVPGLVWTMSVQSLEVHSEFCLNPSSGKLWTLGGIGMNDLVFERVTLTLLWRTHQRKTGMDVEIQIRMLQK